MEDLSKVRRAFVRSSKAWYHHDRFDVSIMIGLYPEDGGTHGEFEVQWEQLGNDLVPRLKVFDDAWKVLPLFQDLLDELAKVDGENISEPEFAQILTELDIKDITEYETPNKYKTYTFMERYDSYLGDKKVSCKEEKILFEIVRDFTDRRGLRQEWEQIDEDIQNEILEKWYDIITKTK